MPYQDVREVALQDMAVRLGIGLSGSSSVPARTQQDLVAFFPSLIRRGSGIKVKEIQVNGMVIPNAALILQKKSMTILIDLGANHLRRLALQPFVDGLNEPLSIAAVGEDGLTLTAFDRSSDSYRKILLLLEYRHSWWRNWIGLNFKTDSVPEAIGLIRATINLAQVKAGVSSKSIWE